MTPEQRIAAIAEREQKATKGPWAWEAIGQQSNEYAVGTAFDTRTNQPIAGEIVRTDDPETDNWLEDRVLLRDSLGLGEGSLADADFIAHAREDVPYLLSALAAAQQENARLTAERDKWQEDAMIYRREKGDAMTHMARAVQERIDAEVRAESAEAQRDALRAALEPFADLSQWVSAIAPMGDTVSGWCGTPEPWRIAQAALAALPAGTEGR